jgi:ribosomal protein S4
MQKKILLKKTREYLQTSFPENLLPVRKIRQSKKKVFFRRTRNLKGQVIKAKNQVFNQYSNSVRKLFILKNFYNPKSVAVSQPFSTAVLTNYYKNSLNFSRQNLSNPPFLFSTNQISYELLRKKKKSSDFKDQLKERKKLALIYGKLSQKYIKKTLKQASKLNGKIYDNFFFLLEARLDVILFRACFFSSIQSARQWINHNKILVNNQLINTSSYKLKPGDIISVKPKHRILLYKKITQFLKNTFFKEVKKIHKQFVISTFLFKKLKSLLTPLTNTRSVLGLPGLIKKNFFVVGSESKPDTVKTPTVFYWPLTGAKVSRVMTEELSPQKKLRDSQKADYKQFFFHVKQVLRSLVNKYSKNKKYLKNTNSFALNLSQAEKKTLLSNLIELELLEKNNLSFTFLPGEKRMQSTFSQYFSPIKGQGDNLKGLRSFLVHLKLKKFFFRNDKKKQSFSLLNQNALRPLNLEISYKNLLIIYLYPPQKITFPCSINMELISRSVA